MAQRDKRTVEIFDAWMYQLERSINQLGFLRGFHSLSAEERRPGDEHDAFFFNKAQMDLIDGQVYLQLVAMEWKQVRQSLDLGGLGSYRSHRLEMVERALKSSLNSMASREGGEKGIF